MFANMIFLLNCVIFFGSDHSFWGGNVDFGSWIRPLNQGSVLLLFSSVASMQTSLIWIQRRKNTPKNLGPKVGSLGIFVTQCTCFGHPKACWVFGTHSVVLESRGPRTPDEQMTKLQNKDGIQEMYPSIPVQAAWMLRWNPEASWGQWLGEILFQHLLEWGRVTILYPIDSSISTDDEVDVYPGEFDPPASLRQMPLRNRRVC